MPDPPAICFYISGHGFGHASRQIEIINALGALSPATPILIRSSAPRWLFDRTLRVPVRFFEGECDTGVVQIDSLHLDVAETIRRADAFHRTLADRAAVERTLLRAHGVTLVVSDAPPLGCAAAAAAGLPSIVISNFTWDWIYEGYAEDLAQAPALRDVLRDTYTLATDGWRLPMHGGFATFKEVRDLPFVARHARHTRAEVRRTCGMPAETPIVLLSFGGYGVKDIDLHRLDCLDRYVVLLTHSAADDAALPDGIMSLPEPELYAAGLRYEDLVAAVDVVMTKPGYGIIAECVANDSAVLYTSRGHFVEYDVLVREMPRYVRAGFIDHHALYSGRWAAALDAVLAAPAPAQRPATDGAEVVARDLRKLM